MELCSRDTGVNTKGEKDCILSTRLVLQQLKNKEGGQEGGKKPVPLKVNLAAAGVRVL